MQSNNELKLEHMAVGAMNFAVEVKDHLTSCLKKDKIDSFLLHLVILNNNDKRAVKIGSPLNKRNHWQQLLANLGG
jgi:hypothetical protein